MAPNQRFQRPSARDAATRCIVAITSWLLGVFTAALITAAEPPLRDIPLQSKIARVQPLTGIVLWTTNENNTGDWIQLEYVYIRYDGVILGKNNYEWSVIDKMLADVASRSHQVVMRFYFVYPGQKADTAFDARYDSGPRLAYLQTGFGLWAEYHIYDGPIKLGKTFPPAKRFKLRLQTI